MDPIWVVSCPSRHFSMGFLYRACDAAAAPGKDSLCGLRRGKMLHDQHWRMNHIWAICAELCAREKALTRLTWRGGRLHAFTKQDTRHDSSPSLTVTSVFWSGERPLETLSCGERMIQEKKRGR